MLLFLFCLHCSCQQYFGWKHYDLVWLASWVYYRCFCSDDISRMIWLFFFVAHRHDCNMLFHRSLALHVSGGGLEESGTSASGFRCFGKRTTLACKVGRRSQPNTPLQLRHSCCITVLGCLDPQSTMHPDSGIYLTSHNSKGSACTSSVRLRGCC